jgi:anti-sigma factor ChrR (cupin superfamily)
MHELASLYALDALDAAEKSAFEEHLRGCPSCEEEVKSFSDVAGALAESVQAEPPAELRANLLARAKSSLRKPGILFRDTGLLISRPEELDWNPIGPGLAAKPLFYDAERQYSTSLVRMDAGAHYPGHRHKEIEELFVLSGDLHIQGHVMRAGDYCRAEPGTTHSETWSDGGCMILLMASQMNEMLA